MSIERRRVVTWDAPVAPPPELCGLDAVRAAIHGAIPPVAALVGFSTSHAEPGCVRMALQPAEYHYNPIGSVHGGIIATVLEAALAAAIRTTLPAGRACITVELKVCYVRALTAATGAVVAEGKVVNAGRQVALADGRLTDGTGRLIATASSTCMVQDAVLVAPAAATQRCRMVEWDDPVAGARRVASQAGLAALRDPSLRAPVAALVGMAVDAVEPGTVRMSLPAAEHLFSQFGAVHGGMIAVLLDSVMGCAVHSTLPAGRGYTTLELQMRLLRPMTAASGVITAIGQIVHGGRRMATAEARAVDSAGRLCATATTTCLVFDLRLPVSILP